jgi:cytochrome c
MRFSLPTVFVLVFAALLPVHAEEMASAGDPVRGAAIYERCGACHSLERNRTGPRHCGLIGRKAGSVPGFHYSKAMKQSGIVWSRPTLDKFLENPRQDVPGTIMTYAGVKDARERADLIAYLERANADPAQCPRE